MLLYCCERLQDASALELALAALAEHKRAELALKNSRREVEEGAAAYAQEAAADFSVAVAQQKELKRLQDLQVRLLLCVRA